MSLFSRSHISFAFAWEEMGTGLLLPLRAKLRNILQLAATQCKAQNKSWNSTVLTIIYLRKLGQPAKFVSLKDLPNVYES